MYLLGLDISTTAAKALIIDENGDVIGTATTPMTLAAPRPQWSEQDPLEWWAGMVTATNTALEQAALSGDAIAAIGLTGQMHGLILLDEAGEVLRPAILWNDQRTAEQCDDIRRVVGKTNLIRICGNDALTGFTAPKILWVRDYEPDVYAKTRHILLPKDYIRYRLSGEMATDKAGGSGTILFDLAERDWSPGLLEMLDIPRKWLPESFEGTAVTGTVSAQAAAATGLAAGTPIVAGGGDQAAQAVGVGAVAPGQVALTLGTSGVVFAAADKPLIEPDGRLHAFCHAVPERWHLMGVMLSAAGSMQWYHDTLTPGDSFAALDAGAAEVPVGSEGLLFLPYLTGERTPHPDPLARGAWVGLTTRHGRDHLTRSVLEGVAFGLRDSFELIKDLGLGQIRRVRISGGGAKSPLWRQIIADVLGVKLVSVNATEGAAFGAALLAGIAAGAWPDANAACRATIRETGETVPNPDQSAEYQSYYATYRGLYPALKDTFNTLA